MPDLEAAPVGAKAVDVAVEHTKPFVWKTNAFKRFFFGDVDGLISHGFRTTLQPEDMVPEDTVSTSYLNKHFEPAWEAELKKEKPLLRRAVLAGNGWTLIYTGVLYGISQACSLAGPLLLREIVGGLQCQAQAAKNPAKKCDPKEELYFFCIGLFLAPLVQSFCENHLTYQLYLAGTRMRNSLMAAIYRKCLRLNNSSLQAESTGKVVTLMSNDAQKLQDAVVAIHAMWGSPAFIVAVLVLLWFQVGWATFVGLGVMLMLTPITGILAAKLGGLRREILQYTDRRVGIMSEVVNGVQMIKYYAWEKPFAAEVMKCRDGEARILKVTAFWQGIFGVLLFSGPVLVAIFCFGSYSIAGNELTAASAYAALAYFSLLRFPMSFLPMLITMIVNALVALQRIGAFLLRGEAKLPETEEKVPPGTVRIAAGEFAWSEPQPKAYQIAAERIARKNAAAQKAGGRSGPSSAGPGKSNATAAKDAKDAKDKAAAAPGAKADHVAVTPEGAEPGSSDKDQEKSQLTGIELDCKPGSLTMIIGSVGCGKSSLLGALVGHMSRRGGSVGVGGSLAYVAQSAWIMNDTVQENVLMGSEMDADRYRLALDVAQLGPDLAMLPNGDLTEIGDRGITLSGGQKQRVSIARAVYANADVYLMDDPLSAVDSHVSAALFDMCIKNTLRGKGKTVVLATNALQYLPQADHVVWMEDGRIKAQGTYQQLVDDAGLNIAELAHLDSESDESDSEAPTDTEAEAKKTRKSLDKDKRKSVDKGKRKSMDKSKITLTRQDTNANRNLTGIEAREAGAISWDVVKTYFSNGGGILVFVLLIVMFGAEQTARVYTDRWVGIWFTDELNRDNWFYLGVYFALGVAYALTTFCRSLNFLFMCVRAAINIHNALLEHLLRLPKSFFDTNPAGRILNRFSRDTDIMDSTLAASLIQFSACVVTYIAILVVISIATAWFAIALVPLTIIYFIIQRYYIPSARELQRIESVTRSPIYSKFGEALLGVATIRAYRKEDHFTHVSDELMETNARAFVTQKLAASWLSMRLDFLGLLVLTGTGALCIQGNIDPGMAGLAIVYALDLTRYLKHGTNMASKSEADFNSVERIVQYLTPEPEADAETKPDTLALLPKEWPEHGTIVVDNLVMRYRPEMPLVLKGVSFSVAGGERVGLVGRTGSGKSSMFVALFRMVEAEAGSITIDGVDIRSLGVRHLRSRMSIIPQDAFLFSGTVRNNLDPFSNHSDEELWRVVESVGLKPAIVELDNKLGAKVVDNGSNFSLGQRQLFCMARAMLRRSRILMLDEATASVDLDLDQKLQAAIREQFSDCTMLTIAHRLNTIMDSDRVIVMDGGHVVENGDPEELLRKDAGVFTRMVEQTGKSSSRYLRSLAQSSSMARVQRMASLLRTGASFAQRGPSGVPQPTGPGSLSRGFTGGMSFAGRPPMEPVQDHHEEGEQVADTHVVLEPVGGKGAPPASRFANEVALQQAPVVAADAASGSGTSDDAASNSSNAAAAAAATQRPADAP